MNAFETLVSGVLRREGIWTYPSYKVLVTKEEKVKIGKPSMPRPEIDILGYRAPTNTLMWIECKSYLDSTGVRRAAFDGSNAGFASRFKVFTDPVYRRVAANRLIRQAVADGLASKGPRLEHWLVAGRIAPGSQAWLEAYFKSQGWILRDRDWIKGHLTTMASEAYEDDAASMVAKLLS